MTQHKKASYPLLNWILIFNLIIISILLLSYYTFTQNFNNLIYPGIKINGVDVSGKTKDQAKSLVTQDLNQKLANPIYLEQYPISFKLDLKSPMPTLDLDKASEQAYNIGRTNNFAVNLYEQFLGIIQGYQVQTTLSYQRPENLSNQINNLSLEVKKDPKNATVNLGENITIAQSSEGLELASSELTQEIDHYLTLNSPAPDSLPTKTISPMFDTTEAQTAKNALELVGVNPIKLHYSDTTLIIDQPTLYSLLNFGSTDLNYTVSESSNIQQKPNWSLIDKTKLSNYLISLSATINQNAQDPRFTLDPTTNKVTDFQAPQTGRYLNIDKTSDLISERLTSNGPYDIDLPIDITQPKIATTDINNLGIKEVVGQGLSYFHGSINNRIYNLTLAASRINGVLIPPGEEFSFDKSVGDISAKTGFKPGYSIKGGKTVLDDGGGVCQISTTMFRAALNAGLPITARTAHAYRVHYYEEGGFPPGIDATIYSPVVDFKFKNDTSNYILVQSFVKDETVTVNLYGTKDGRIVNITTPKILSQNPPPPEVRQDDPTLAVGVVKQVEFPAWGANVIFSRTVVKDGKTIINESFKSNFQPWAAVYLVGTKTS